MKVTRVVFYSKAVGSKALAVCSIILDDELRLNNISLFKNESGYFLTLPSKQDIYSQVQRLNPDYELVLAKPIHGFNGNRPKYEEFYHPINGGLYKNMLESVVEEYEKQ